ncbi:DUF805 domain-containing protein [Massilia genomosp. 1]|uniref:DUF805 domain-containing protein n=1 Tax=Massilia genomosp. 1 TaxID=2609280 RepID=A0ABX0MS53_9BURK|nr:DUF805 domain-containing protein [Massilia genomosp. 1]NHZ65580.1 DUF805 domain-containing protein [Massilia genomosp. 1]
MTNLYAAPSADMRATAYQGDTYLPRMFQKEGRIGRVRYLVYEMVITVLTVAAMSVLLSWLIPAYGPMLSMFAVAVWIPSTAVTLVVTRRRLHDLGKSGWLGLLHLVPVANLFFGLWMVFGRGDPDANQFGVPPAPTTRPLVIAAFLIPVAIIAVLPGYQDIQEKWFADMVRFKTDELMKEYKAKAAAKAATAGDDVDEDAAASDDASADGEQAAAAPEKAGSTPAR